MATNKENSPAPKVSKLPLPATDSPLVIDLPDGQKLVIGKMSRGSVIEVATWRGTGRPDSRTSRLMLGMSNGQSEAIEDQEVNQDDLKKVVAPESGIERYVFLVQQFLLKSWKKISPILKKIIPTLKISLTRLKGIARSKVNSRKKIAEVISSESNNSEVDEWLNRIIKKSERDIVKSSNLGQKQGAVTKNKRKASSKGKIKTVTKRKSR
jgi:hypothetical protein